MSQNKIISIEYFKDPNANGLVIPELPFKLFQSSGTTSVDRSRVWFSKEGLDLYQCRAIRDFEYFLKHYFHSDQIESLEGFSFIPPSNVSPDSSLSQMLTWISERHYVTFLSHTEIEKIPLDKSVWVFGTGFDWWNLCENLPGQIRRLNSNSLLIDTGGMKALDIETPEDEIRIRLSRFFGLSMERFASEYGMCELSCQAYSIYSPSAGQIEAKHRFQFAEDVKTFVVSASGEKMSSGKGVLAVYDPKRIDIEGAILTQDLVELYSDGTFSLQGRVRTASLKSCSLTRREEIFRNDSKSTDSAALPTGHNDFLRRSSFDIHRLSKLKDLISSIQQMEDQEAQKLLSKEFLCSEWASRFLEDFFSGFEKTSKLETRHTDKVTFFVPSSSHSFSLLYPIVASFLSGVPFFIRDPFSKNDKRFFHFFLQRVLGDSYSKIMVSKDFRLSPVTFDALMHATRGRGVKVVLSSNNSTKREISELLGENEKVQGQFFAEMDSVAFVSLDWLMSKGSSEEILYQSFALMQAGCRSLKALYVVVEDDSLTCEGSLEIIQSKVKNVLTTSFEILSTNMKIQGEYSFGLVFEKLKHRLGELPTAVEFPYFYFSSCQNPSSQRAFSLPVVVVERSCVASFLKTRLLSNSVHFQTSRIGYSPDIENTIRSGVDGMRNDSHPVLQRISTLQHQEWNGMMDGQVL